MPITQNRMVAILTPSKKLLTWHEQLTQHVRGLVRKVELGELDPKDGLLQVQDLLLKNRLTFEEMAPIIAESEKFSPQHMEMNERKRLFQAANRGDGTKPISKIPTAKEVLKHYRRTGQALPWPEPSLQPTPNPPPQASVPDQTPDQTPDLSQYQTGGLPLGSTPPTLDGNLFEEESE